MDKQIDSRRIAKNTVVLYIRMMLMTVISLYTSRVVLNTLGVKDFGIYNVVGGFVAMFTLISGSLSNTISRFITYELGKNDKERLKTVFSNAILIQVFLAVVILLLAEVIGVWFLNAKMQIPEGRMVAANWVLQCSIFSFVVNLINIPYHASIIAHEKMTAFAYISILESFLKLGIVFCLYLNVGDKLIAYSLLLLGVAITIRLIYGIYCSKRFEECHFHPKADKKLLKEMTSLASWNFLGSGAAILNNHGINILINIFFGVVFNASRGIANQVNAAVNQFVNSFTTAMNPQITKLYASGNLKEMFKLVFRGSKFAYFLMFLIACPVIVETPYILKLWLNVVPDCTVLFVRLTLIQSLINTLITPLFIVIMATGDVKSYYIWISSLLFLVFLFSYLLYFLGYPVEVAYYISIGINFISLFVRLFILHRQVGLNIFSYIKNVLSRILLVSFITIIILILFTQKSTDHNFSTFMENTILVLFTTITITYIAGLEKKERSLVLDFFKRIKSRVIKL